MKDFNFNIRLFCLWRCFMACQFEATILSITVGEVERSLVSYYKDGGEYILDVCFLRVRWQK